MCSDWHELDNCACVASLVPSRLDGAHKYGRQLSVKTTLEIPEPLFRKVKATAARQGRTLKQLVQEALSEKIARVHGVSRKQKPWMVLAGGLKHLHSENRRIERVIEAEFEAIAS